MVNLVIDIGNTLTKVSVFSEDRIVYNERRTDFPLQQLIDLVRKYAIQQIIVSSVRGDVDLADHIDGVPVCFFNSNTAVPIVNNYQTPQTLGVDRLAGVIGAKTIFADSPVLVIDFGSCITFDYIDQAAHYTGGAISPGMRMRFKAMHHFTGKLPEIDDSTSTTAFSGLVGTSTKEALQAGVINGIVFEVEGYIQKYNDNNIDLKVILCGGDASFFDTRLKNSIFAHQILLEPDLVPIGLNTVVKYQHDRKS